MNRPAKLPSLAPRAPVIPANDQARTAEEIAAPGDGSGRRYASLRRHGVRVGAYAVAVICLLWPTLLNSQYIFFYDTTGYLRSAIQAFHVAGIESDWSALYNALPAASGVQSAGADAAPPGAAAATDGFISAARSVYYGAVLYLGELLGSLWIGLAFQMLAVGLAIYLTLHAILGVTRDQLPITLGLLGLFTPLSFFASYLMPDIFASITILACAALLVFFDRLSLWARGLWFALLGVSVVFHTSHIAIAALLAMIGALIVRGGTGRVPWKAAGWVSTAIAIGVLSQAIFFRTVEAVYGHPPLHPPFLMARVIADGPGYDYLRATCPDDGFKVCEFLPVLPLSTDEFLWSRDPNAGVFGPADPATRRALVEEQLPFVANVLRYDFPGQFVASLRGFLEQLSRFDINEFRYTPSLRHMVMENLPPADHAAFKNSLLYRDEFPLAVTSILFYIAFGVSALVLIWGLWRLASDAPMPYSAARPLRTARKRLLLFSFAVLSGVAANAAVTGVLSTPHDRYQARVIWLVTLLALSVFLFLRRQRRAMPVLTRGKNAHDTKHDHTAGATPGLHPRSKS